MRKKGQREDWRRLAATVAARFSLFTTGKVYVKSPSPRKGILFKGILEVSRISRRVRSKALKASLLVINISF
jgi:hypothetical protein